MGLSDISAENCKMSSSLSKYQAMCPENKQKVKQMLMFQFKKRKIEMEIDLMVKCMADINTWTTNMTPVINEKLNERLQINRLQNKTTN